MNASDRRRWPAGPVERRPIPCVRDWRAGTLAALMLLALLPPGAAAARADSPEAVVLTVSGPVIASPDGVYRGIPYAAPPVGELRFKPPAPPALWTNPRAFDRPGPQCPQEDASGETAEDCLYLNVRTPARTPGDRLPVMVFIHGGGFTSGAGSLDIYSGRALADEGVVLVTMNYRLGPLGFLAHPLLSAESPNGVSGNYGLLDQQAALAWVRANIAAFGGDPDNVTVFGQSAGAASILLHMTSPAAGELFHKAILQSPVIAGGFRPLKLAVRGVLPAEEIGRRIAARLVADKALSTLAALRAATPAELIRAARLGPEAAVEVAGLICPPTVDGWLIPEHPLDAFGRGRQYKKPLMVGATANEASLFLEALNPPVTSLPAYTALVQRRFGADAPEVLGLLPGRGERRWTDAVLAMLPGRSARLWEDLDRLIGSRWFESAARFTAGAQAAAGAPCHQYRHTLAPPIGALLALEYEANSLFVSPGRAGVPHGADLFPVFGFESRWLGFGDADRAVGRAMRAAWASFARTGDPVVPGVGPWPRFTPDDPRIVEFGRAARVIPLPAEPLQPFVERSWGTTTY